MNTVWDRSESPGRDSEMNRQFKWDRRYLELSMLVATWSKDPSTKVGAVLVRPNNSVAATGFNGFPPGHDDAPELYADREYKYQHVIHAEVNALNFYGSPAVGFTLYTSFPCCPDCVRAAAKAGVARIVCHPIRGDGKDLQWWTGWRIRIEESIVAAREHSVSMEILHV